MFKQRLSLLAFMVFVFTLVACQANTPQAPAATTTAAATLARTASSITVVSPTATTVVSPTPPARLAIDSTQAALQELIGYVSGTWSFYHGDVMGSESGDDLVGPVVYLLDLARIRSDLDLPHVSETLTTAQRLKLIEAINGLGFDLSYLNLADENFAEQWGWDITDVSHLLRFTSSVDNTELFAMRGNFDGTRIEQRLKQRGYKSTTSPSPGFKKFFSAQRDQPTLTWRENVLLMGTDVADLDVATLTGGRSQKLSPNLQPLLPHLPEAWSIIMAPGGATAAWDVMALAYNGSQQSDNLKFVYSYPSATEARQDVDLIKERVAKTTSGLTSQPWATQITIDAAQAADQVLTAKGNATQIAAIHKAFLEGDVGFLPFRTEATIETALENGWRLYQKPAKGFAIALPRGWMPLALTKRSVAESIAEIAQQDAQAADAFAKTVHNFLQGSGDFLALKFFPSGELRAYMTLIGLTPLAGGVSNLDETAAGLVKDLERRSQVIKPVERQRVSLLAGEAARITYAYQTGKAGEMPGRAVQYLLVNGRTIYVIGFFLSEDTQESLAQVQQIAESFRLLK